MWPFRFCDQLVFQSVSKSGIRPQAGDNFVWYQGLRVLQFQKAVLVGCFKDNLSAWLIGVKLLRLID